MPELPPTINANVTRIDAPFPEEWGEQFHGLITELQGIQSVVGALSTSLKESSQATTSLAETYSPEGGSVKASRANTEEASQNLLDQYGRPFYAALAAEGQRTNPTPGRPSEQPPEASGEPFKISEMPQYFGGHYTTQDILKIAGQGANWLRQGSNMEEAPEGANWRQRLQAGIPSSASETLKGISGGLETATKGTPYISLAGQYFNSGLTKLTGQPVSGPFALSDQMKSIGGNLGYQNIGANNATTLGPLGIVPPIFNPQSLGGLTQTASSLGESLTTPGLTTEQSLSMKEGLSELGWFPWQKKTEKMQGALAELHVTSPELAENPEVRESLDKATRSGTTSIQQWLATMKQIPEAAFKANTSIAKMKSEMAAYGALTESKGGTNIAGERQALAISALTGMPPEQTAGLMSSPWATAQIFRSTGEPEWMQGNLPGGLKNEAAMQSFFLAANTVGKPANKHYKTLGGFEYTTSGVEQQAAMMKKFMFPEMNVATIEKLLRMGPGAVQKAAETEKASEAWLNQTEALFGKKKPKGMTTAQWHEAQNTALSGKFNKPGSFGHLLQVMSHEEENGHHLYSQEDLKKIRTNEGRGYTGHGKTLAEEKEKEVQKILATKAAKRATRAGNPENQVTVELGPAAKKLLRLSNGKEVERLKINAGSGGNTNALSSGYTENLVPAPQAPGLIENIESLVK